MPFGKHSLTILLLAATGCGNPSSPPGSPLPEAPPAAGAAKESGGMPIPGLERPLNSNNSAPAFRFVPLDLDAGIDFTYYGSPSAQRYMVEQNGGGVGILDYDGDGTPDLFFANGSHFEKPAEAVGARHRLYRAVDRLRYEDIAAAAGVGGFGFGMGCAAGDFDNDGFTDLYLAGYGTHNLWRNQGDGTFREVTAAAGLGTAQWGTSAAFADLDGDGDLDLYVVNYVEWSPTDPPCFTQHQKPVRISCGPIGRAAQYDGLYRNEGDGNFSEIGEAAGIRRPNGKGLGLAIADFNDDGRLDVYVANDTTENFLFQNLGSLKFDEIAVASGCAVGADGLAHSGMGVACGDFNNDGRLDLCVTNFDNEPNDLYENLGDAGFRAVNRELGLDPIAKPMLGFGILFTDFDLDGWLDMFVANGHVWDLTSLEMRYTYQMPAQVIRNLAGQRFVDVSTSSGDYFRQPRLGRAAASGDLDGDGDEDVVVTNTESPSLILRNDSPQSEPGVALRVIGVQSARQPLGVRVEIRGGNRMLTRWLPAGGSYQASNYDEIIVPRQTITALESVRVVWPNGQRETWRDLEVTPRLVLIEGTGARD